MTEPSKTKQNLLQIDKNMGEMRKWAQGVGMY